jgi:hypothetical protein
VKFLTTEEAKSWCQARGLRVTADRYLNYEPESTSGFTVGLEEKPSSLIGLSDHLIPAWEDVPFEGALLWIRQRDIWGDHSERTGAVMIDQMRLADGESASLEERPGHLFGRDEAYKAHAYFLLPAMFGWDAFLIPESGDYFTFISHDGVAEVMGRNAEKTEELRQRLREWSPQEDKSWYPRVASK